MSLELFVLVCFRLCCLWALIKERRGLQDRLRRVKRREREIAIKMVFAKLPLLLAVENASCFERVGSLFLRIYETRVGVKAALWQLD